MRKNLFPIALSSTTGELDDLPEVLDIVEGGLGSDAVDQDEALSVLHVEVPHRRELLRTCEHTD